MEVRTPLLSERKNNEDVDPPASNTVSALIKITFFFYQTASIVRIEASAKTAYHTPYVVTIVSSFFNVKVDAISTNTITDSCPIETTSVTVISLFRISLVFACLLLFVTAMFVCYIVLLIQRKFRKEPSLQLNQQQTKSFLNRLKGSYVQLLLIGYLSIAVFCLQAVHCIDINGQSYLYTQAETVKCFQPWQNVVLVIIVTWVVPFPFVLYVACRCLRTYLITPNEFLAVITFPPTIIYYLIRQCYLTNSVMNDQGVIETENILAILNEPFQYTDQYKKLIWEPVLIFRRLLLVVTATFITSSVKKLYPAGLLLFVFLVHDFIVQPFDSRELNFIQLFAVCLLMVLTLLNTFWAYSNDIDFMKNEQFYNMGKVFLYSEMFILLLPFLAVAVLVTFKIGKFLYKRYRSKQD